MAARFGRNQRRRLRDLVASLEHKLFSEYAKATGCYPEITQLIGPVLESEVTEYKRSREAGKCAELLVYATQDQGKLHDLFVNQRYPFVEYSGYVWRLREIEVEIDKYDRNSIYEGRSRHAYIGGPPTLTLKLDAQPAPYR